MRSPLFKAALLAAFCFAPVKAQDCTHTTVQANGGSIVPFGVQKCRAGVTVAAAGFNLSLTVGHCPDFVLITPPHNAPMAQAGCGTDAVFAMALPLSKVSMLCQRQWLVIIPIGVACVQQPSVVMQMVSDHTVRACAKIPH